MNDDMKFLTYNAAMHLTFYILLFAGHTYYKPVEDFVMLYLGLVGWASIFVAIILKAIRQSSITINIIDKDKDNP